VSLRGALAASAVFVLVGPLLEMVVGPALLTSGFESGDGLPAVLRVPGALLIAGGVALVAAAMWQFATEGRGTPSPAMPAQRLVTGGVYRRLSHPIYVGTTAVIVGEALLLRRPVLLLAAAAYAVTFAIVVRVHEGPKLRERFGR
jgi:protein-S-isoprenylcysteine O-methyltransferase Ste14